MVRGELSPLVSAGAIPGAVLVLVAHLAAAEGCFEAHVREAIALNTERRAVYAALSAGASEPISDRLLALEHATLPVARAFDRRAAVFVDAGIPVMCEEFVPMAGAGVAARMTPPGEYPGPVDGLGLAVDLARARSRGGWPGMVVASEQALSALGPPEYHCMTRHLLESVRRAAGLAPRHLAATRALGWRWYTPQPLSRAFVALQVDALPAAAALDESAAVLQSGGIPILCRDLPDVPPVG